jgi:hypothetical protein
MYVLRGDRRGHERGLCGDRGRDPGRDTEGIDQGGMMYMPLDLQMLYWTQQYGSLLIVQSPGKLEIFTPDKKILLFVQFRED